MEQIGLSALVGVVVGAGLVIVGTLWAGRRHFIRENRIRLAQEIVPKFREKIRAEDWTGAEEHLSLLISSAWAVGIEDHLLIVDLQLASDRLDKDIDNDAALDTSKQEVEKAIGALQKRLHEAILGRSLSSVRRRALARRLKSSRQEAAVGGELDPTDEPPS